MLIGDKGQGGGRRWEVSGFGLGPFSASPKVRRWGGGLFGGFRYSDRSSGQTLGGDFCPKAIFLQSQGPSLWRWPDLPSGHFRAVPRSVAGLCILLIQGFATGHPAETHKGAVMFNQRILSIDHPY